MKRATRYEILKGVEVTSMRPCAQQPSEKPLRVAMLLDEAEFVRSGGLLSHHANVFLDERLHDWEWRQGKLYYYGHGAGVGETCDIVVVLEQEEAAGAPKA